MNPIERYKRILSTNFSEIHSHIPIEYLGDSLPPESQKHFKTLKSLGNIFITSKGPKDEVLLDIFDFSKLCACVLCKQINVIDRHYMYVLS